MEGEGHSGCFVAKGMLRGSVHVRVRGLGFIGFSLVGYEGMAKKWNYYITTSYYVNASDPASNAKNQNEQLNQQTPVHHASALNPDPWVRHKLKKHPSKFP